MAANAKKTGIKSNAQLNANHGCPERTCRMITAPDRPRTFSRTIKALPSSQQPRPCNNRNVAFSKQAAKHWTYFCSSLNMSLIPLWIAEPRVATGANFSGGVTRNKPKTGQTKQHERVTHYVTTDITPRQLTCTQGPKIPRLQVPNHEQCEVCYVKLYSLSVRQAGNTTPCGKSGHSGAMLVTHPNLHVLEQVILQRAKDDEIG